LHNSKFSFNDIVEKWKPDYMSIIFLTLHYQRKQGLRLLHYRYALVKKDEISSGWEQEMTEFFGWKLKQLYILHEIHKCITTRQNLVKKLHNLVEWGILKPIKKTKKRNYPLYKINKKNYKKIDTIIRKNRLKKLFEYEIDQCSGRKLTKIEKTIEDYLEIKKPEPPKIRVEEKALTIIS